MMASKESIEKSLKGIISTQMPKMVEMLEGGLWEDDSLDDLFCVTRLNMSNYEEVDDMVMIFMVVKESWALEHLKEYKEAVE